MNTQNNFLNFECNCKTKFTIDSKMMSNDYTGTYKMKLYEKLRKKILKHLLLKGCEQIVRGQKLKGECLLNNVHLVQIGEILHKLGIEHDDWFYDIGNPRR